MENSRRNFLKKLSMGAIGTAVLSSLPFNLFAGNKKKRKSTIKVNIHPQAVKRTK